MTHCKRLISCLAITGLLVFSCAASASCQEHIRKFDTIRAAMAKMGSTLPELTKKAQPRDIRTMERVFEINNYSLAAIESYFMMTKIALVSGAGLNKDVMEILNRWLKFVSNYCEYDIKYIDEALSQTKDTAIIEILKSEKNNIASLREASQFGINENAATSDKLPTSQ
jgi:hypothetical protein